MEARMMDKLKTKKLAPKILIADDDPCVLRAVAGRCTRIVQVPPCGHAEGWS